MNVPNIFVFSLLNCVWKWPTVICNDLRVIIFHNRVQFLVAHMPTSFIFPKIELKHNMSFQEVGDRVVGILGVRGECELPICHK